MCYTKKLAVDEFDGRSWRQKFVQFDFAKFEGQFDCTKFNCNGCNEGFLDGEPPKRKKG